MTSDKLFVESRDGVREKSLLMSFFYAVNLTRITDVLQLHVGVKIEPSPSPWPAGWSKWTETLHAGSNGLN